MPSSLNDNLRTKKLTKNSYGFFEIVHREKFFALIVLALGLLCLLVYPYPQIAMWVGFGLAGYAAIANDSIQTIGTFIASNKHRKWYYLWLFMGLIFLVTVYYSWTTFDGDVSNQRLTSKGFEQAPTEFTFLQLAAPLILLIITRMRMPVSTTFLLLNAFSTKTSTIIHILDKSLSGYFLAFFLALAVWLLVSKFVNKFFKGKPHQMWVVFQWITSGLLWSVWLQQDAANIAIYLPRSLSMWQFVGFASYIFLGLGLLFYLKGDKIQGIVDEKSGVTDVRAATLVDFIYAILLYYKLFESTIPMSTTWLFIGLLGGRELAISLTRNKYKKRKKATVKAFKMIGKDMLYALIGLIISMILALAINDEIRREIMGMLKDFFA
ncbi:MAG: hypothetical protein HC819_02715 [Cyclobacteriaceae bacterium]|nr:hypothetical protein [Cyclobacteriaceae bacterium]